MNASPAPARLTLADARTRAQSMGMSLTRKDDEYRVNFRGGCEDTAYYTNDLADALATARDMSERAARLGRCAHCGEIGERAGHMGCQYPA